MQSDFSDLTGQNQVANRKIHLPHTPEKEMEQYSGSDFPTSMAREVVKSENSPLEIARGREFKSDFPTCVAREAIKSENSRLWSCCED